MVVFNGNSLNSWWFTGIFWWFNGGFKGIYGGVMGFEGGLINGGCMRCKWMKWMIYRDKNGA